MKKILFALSLLACAAAATAQDAADEIAARGAHCVSFAPSGFCDGMQFDSNKKATWIKFDCSNNGAQTSANYRKGTTFCDGTKGCNPAAPIGFDSVSWKFDKTASTGTLTGIQGGVSFTFLTDTPVAITSGACTFNGTQGGKSSLSR